MALTIAIGLMLSTLGSAHQFEDWAAVNPVGMVSTNGYQLSWADAGDRACRYRIIKNGTEITRSETLAWEDISYNAGDMYSVEVVLCSDAEIFSHGLTVGNTPIADHCAPGESLADRRFGYGRGVQPPANMVTVSNWSEFETAAENGNVWIQWDASLSNQIVPMTSLVSAGPNVWVDGSRAVNATFRATTSGTRGISFRQGNGVVHGMRIDSDNRGSSRVWFIEGQNYWADKLEFLNSTDDVMVISSDNQGALSNVTLSFIYSHDNVKGMLINAKTNSPVNSISMHGNRLKDNDSRNWRWQAADRIHDWNSLIEDVSIGINGRISVGDIGSNTVSRALVESNVYSNVGNPWNISNTSSSVDPAYQHYLYTDGLNVTGSGSLIGNIDEPGAPAVHSIPYMYIKKPVNEVVSYATSCAGIGSI